MDCEATLLAKKMYELFPRKLLKTVKSITLSKPLTKQQNLSEKIIRRESHTMIAHVIVRFPAEITKVPKLPEIAMLDSNENPCAPFPVVFVLNRVSGLSAIVAIAGTAYRDSFIAHVQRWRNAPDRDILFPVFAIGANFVLFDVAPMMSNKAVKAFARADIFVRSYANFPCLDETFVGVPTRDMWEKRCYLTAVKCL
jgi:histidinol-phosphate/aromatic aminotransferase/cobyric acid decarboxylase-like protein